MNIPQGLFKVNLNEVMKSALSAVFAAAVFAFGTVLHGVFSAPDFNLFAVQWGVVLTTAFNAAVAAAYSAFVGVIGRYFLTDAEGTTHLGFMKIKTTK